MRKVVVCGVTMLLSSAVSARAEPFSGDGTTVFKNNAFSADVSVGALRGKIKEFVFNPDGSLLSQLNWRLDNVAVVSGGLAWSPINWFTLGVRGRTNLSDSGTSDDFDFPGALCGIDGPYCLSNSENTRVDNADSIDIYGSATLYQKNGLKLSGLAGFRLDHYGFTAIGGTSNYSLPFPNSPSIIYDQWWEVPYVGLEASGQWNKFSLQARITGSLWADGRDRDDHRFRELLFTEDFRSSNYAGVSVKAGYAVAENILLTAGYDYDRWFLATGLTTITEYGDGPNAPAITYPATSGYGGGSAETHTISAGVKVSY